MTEFKIPNMLVLVVNIYTQLIKISNLRFEIHKTFFCHLPLYYIAALQTQNVSY